MYRRILSYDTSKESIEQNIKIIRALIDFNSTGEKVWWNYILEKYSQGIVDGIINKNLDRLDAICQNEYEKNQAKDKCKTNYKDWLLINPNELLYMGVKYNESGIVKGLTIKEYQKAYRLKRKMQKEKLLASIR